MTSNRIKVSGKVRVKNGDEEQVCKNHIVNSGINGLLKSLIVGDWYADLGTGENNWHCEIGSDTSTTTSSSTSSLVSTISSSQDTKSGDLSSGAGFYEVTYHFTWNSGSVTGTLGELGLYLTVITEDIGFGGAATYTSEGLRLFTRLSSADGDFSSFVIDDTKPLTIDWTVRFEFV